MLGTSYTKAQINLKNSDFFFPALFNLLSIPKTTFLSTANGSGGPFLESNGHFSGPKSKSEG